MVLVYISSGCLGFLVSLASPNRPKAKAHSVQQQQHRKTTKRSGPAFGINEKIRVICRQQRCAAQVSVARVGRGFIERKRRQRETSGATVLQAGWRGYNARKAFETSRAAKRSLEARRATTLQARRASCSEKKVFLFCEFLARVVGVLSRTSPHQEPLCACYVGVRFCLSCFALWAALRCFEVHFF